MSFYPLNVSIKLSVPCVPYIYESMGGCNKVKDVIESDLGVKLIIIISISTLKYIIIL